MKPTNTGNDLHCNGQGGGGGDLVPRTLIAWVSRGNHDPTSTPSSFVPCAQIAVTEGTPAAKVNPQIRRLVECLLGLPGGLVTPLHVTVYAVGIRY
jgi:hypothetical protein